MQAWWSELTAVTQFFCAMASFFSVFFLWQLIGAFLGMSGDEVDIAGGGGDDLDFGSDGADMGDDQGDLIDSSQAFRLLSLRSIITFFTLFSWGSALYTMDGSSAPKAMAVSAVWGLVGMVLMALIIWGLNKLTETGTKDINTAMGQIGSVYLNIPAVGEGEVKLLVSGVMTHVRARSTTGEALVAGTPVRVVKLIGLNLLGVEKLKEKGDES